MNTKTVFRSVARLAVLCIPIGLAGPAVAQNDLATAPPDDSDSSGVSFRVTSGVESRFDADLDDGGEIGVTRFNFGLAVGIPVNDKWSVDFRSSYDFADFDFSGGMGLAALDPWTDVHTVEFGTVINYQCSEDWQFFGGPVIQLARESGADWDDGITGGGVLGATRVINDKLVLGGGIGMMSQIEDDVRLFPIIVVNWKIRDRLTLTSTAANTRGGGFELVYELGNGWEVAAGGAYQFERFRLDDSGIAPDGVGESAGLPVWGRVSYDLDENIDLDLYGGLYMGGQLDVYDDDGDRIIGDDADASMFIGLGVRIDF